jgi:predicted dehydrogenase
MACVRRYPELFDVVGVAVPEEEEIQAWTSRKEFDGLSWMTVEELLARDDLDAVMVECEDWNLIRYAQMCIDAGKHIHLDKPAGESIPDYERLMETAKRKNLTVQLAYMYRYNPAIVKTLEMVRNGELGEILEIDAVMSTDHPDNIRIWLQHFQGGTMHTFGCHLVDLVLLFGGMPDRIIPFRKKTMLGGIDVYDHDFAVFEYPKGISTIRTSSFEVDGFNRRQFVVCGSEGTVELKPLETGNLEKYTEMYLSTKKTLAGQPGRERRRNIDIPPIGGRYDTMMLDFAAMVRGEKQNPFTYEYELAVQRACLASCGFDVDLKG